MKVAWSGYSLSSKYNLKYIFPFTEFTTSNADLNVCFSSYELQPKSECFNPNSTKFVGACINTTIRLDGLDSSKEKSSLETFLDTVTKKRLIYLSLGTLFNQKLSVYTKFITVFSSKELQTLDRDFIISTGAYAYGELQKLIQSGQLKVANNIRIVSSAPQLRILQNCSLFVTHCGFNSVNEAIHFSVPMICVPISADQPLVAHRVANDLKLGIKLDSNNFSVNDAIIAVKSIINDVTYYERVKEYSEMSKKYDGPINFSNEIINYLNANSNTNK